MQNGESNTGGRTNNVIPIKKDVRKGEYFYNPARITKKNGQIFISTGNYLFPRDGETNTWFYHWLTKETKEIYNKLKGMTADNYWLLDWKEIVFLIKTCGLSLQEVFAPDAASWDNTLIDRLASCFQGIDSHMIGILRELIHSHPSYFPSYFLILTKNANLCEEPFLASDRCMYSRAGFKCCPTPDSAITIPLETHELLMEEKERQIDRLKAMIRRDRVAV